MTKRKSKNKWITFIPLRKQSGTVPIVSICVLYDTLLSGTLGEREGKGEQCVAPGHMVEACASYAGMDASKFVSLCAPFLAVKHSKTLLFMLKYLNTRTTLAVT